MGEPYDLPHLYQNYLVVVPDEFEPRLNSESSGFSWPRPGELRSYLHPGLQAFLESDIARAQFDSLDARCGI